MKNGILSSALLLFSVFLFLFLRHAWTRREDKGRRAGRSLKVHPWPCSFAARPLNDVRRRQRLYLLLPFSYSAFVFDSGRTDRRDGDGPS